MKRLIKFGLVGILSCFGLSCFCNAGNYHHVYDFQGGSFSNGNYYIALNYPSKGIPSELTLNCTITNLDGTVGNNCSNFVYNIQYINQYFLSNSVGKITVGTLYFYSGYNFTITKDFSNYSDYHLFSFITFGISSCGLTFPSLSFDCTFSGDDVVDTTCPECEECQTCPEVDTNYCVENDLCPVPSNFSQLYINDIEHESAPVINVDIPEEILFDYTVDSGEFNLQVSGYNVDTDYIEGLINTQNYKPNSQDFNKVITGLVPLIIPGLVIILFIRFIFRFIKKIF